MTTGRRIRTRRRLVRGGGVVGGTAAWSADGNIAIFWFASGDIPADNDLDAFRLVAYDENGQVMPF